MRLVNLQSSSANPNWPSRVAGGFSPHKLTPVPGVHLAVKTDTRCAGASYRRDWNAGFPEEVKMTSIFSSLETDEGLVHIITRNRWLYIFPLYYTSIVPNGRGDLAHKGTFIRWNTSEYTKLPSLHQAVIHLVEDIGISGVADMAVREKQTAHVAKAMGISYRELCYQAIKSRNPIPVLDDVLKHVKKFM